MLMKLKPDTAAIETARLAVEKELGKIESYFLKEQDYLTGGDITVADLMCCMEVNTIGYLLYDWEEGHPKLATYMARVAERLNPYYDDFNKAISQLAYKMMGRGSAPPAPPEEQKVAEPVAPTTQPEASTTEEVKQATEEP